MKLPLVVLTFVGFTLLTPTKRCQADDDRVSELVEINSSLLRNQSIYTTVVMPLVRPGINEKGISRGLELTGLLNAISFYRTREEQPTLNYNISFAEEWQRNFIVNLENDVVFISFMEGEAVFSGKDGFTYGQQAWYAFADTVTRRYKIGRWADYIAQKIQNVTSVSYTSKETGVKMRMGPYFGEPLGLYISAQKNRLKLMCVRNDGTTKLSLGWVFDKVDIGNKLSYLELSNQGNDTDILFLYKERF